MIRRILAIVAALALLPVSLAAMPASARAQPAGGTCHTLPCQEKYIYHKVMGSAHPKATYAKLSKPNKKLFGKATRPVKTKFGGKSRKVLPPYASASTRHRKPWTCWVHNGWFKWDGPFGGDTMQTWVNMKWCISNKTGLITLNQLVGGEQGQGGTTGFPGWSYNGVIGYNHGITGAGTSVNMADQAIEVQFNLGIGNALPIFNTDLCSQDSAQPGNTGYVFQLKSCKLYCSCGARALRPQAIARQPDARAASRRREL